jgi:hypothetical protein
MKMNSTVRIALFHTYSRSCPALTLFASFKPSPTPWFSWFNSCPTATRWETGRHKVEHRSWEKELNGAALTSPQDEVLLDKQSSMKAPMRLEWRGGGAGKEEWQQRVGRNLLTIPFIRKYVIHLNSKSNMWVVK